MVFLLPFCHIISVILLLCIKAVHSHLFKCFSGYPFHNRVLENSCLLEQFAGVGPVVSIVARFPQQTENRTFCPVLQS